VFVLLFIGLFNVFDFQMNVPAVIVLAALPVAWLDATSADGIGLGRVGAATAIWVGRGAQVALWVGCALAVMVLFRAESIATTHQTALSATYSADWAAAREPAADAWAADPDYPPYAITRGLVASGEADWQTAAEAYGFAAPTDDMAQSWLGLAQAQAALGADDAEVAASIERGLRIGSQQPSIVFAAGALYDRLGDTDRAGALYAQTLTRYPGLAADPYWRRDAAMAARFDEILAFAEERAPGQAWELALAAGTPDRARELAQNELQADIIEAWEGDADALAAVYAVADVEAANPAVLGWAARLASRVGDDDRAQRYQRLAVFEVTEGGELPGTEIEIDEDGWLEAVPAGTEVGFAGRYLYRRPLGPDLLPPGLPRLVFAGSTADTTEDAAGEDAAA
jgi:tetratricopeptide (TPR) repeat protein